MSSPFHRMTSGSRNTSSQSHNFHHKATTIGRSLQFLGDTMMMSLRLDYFQSSNPPTRSANLRLATICFGRDRSCEIIASMVYPLRQSQQRYFCFVLATFLFDDFNTSAAVRDAGGACEPRAPWQTDAVDAGGTQLKRFSISAS